jgi:hypothetical protein
VERTADELSQIMQSEDRERQTRTRYAAQLVKGWVEQEGCTNEKRAVHYLTRNNLPKALGSAMEAQKNFEYSKTQSNVGQLISDIKERIKAHEEAKKKQNAEDSLKPKANEVNLRFKQMVMDESDSIRALFNQYDSDASGVLSPKEFRMVSFCTA